MELSQLYYFKTIAELENISKAADKVYISQSNLSRSIMKLESELGVSLFEHRKGKIELNEYGNKFLNTVNGLFNDLERGVEDLQKFYVAKQNSLNLACPIDDFLPDLLMGFSAVNPHMGIHQYNHTSQTIEEKLLSGTLDIALCSDIIVNENITFEILAQNELVLLVGQNHWLAKCKTVSVIELKKERFVCDRAWINREKLNKICMGYNFLPEIDYEVENCEYMYHLLETNAVVTFAPLPQYVKRIIQEERSEIRGIRIEEEIPKAIIGLAYNKNYNFTEASSKFIEYVKKILEMEEKRIAKLNI